MPRILFVGQARREKGLLDLIDATSKLTNSINLQVVGPQDPGPVSSLEQQHDTTNVGWINHFVSDAELANLYKRSSIVAVPYRSSFRHHGGASGGLSRALAHAQPVVTTETGSDQLPMSCGGAVVVPADNVSALTEGLEQALQATTALTAAAVVEGPAFIHKHHTFEAYVTALPGRTNG